MDQRRYCSQLAAGEPLAGTADPLDVWLLLEYRPPWRAKAVTDNDLADDVRSWFGGLPEAVAHLGSKARPQLVRQPEREDEAVRLMVAVGGSLYEFQADSYRELMRTPVADVVATPERFLDHRCPETRYFVCTNGQRDLCCARFGLPVYRALRERVGGRVWQATHLGGHRFAPNVLVLPQSALYGRVSEESLDAFLADTEGGALHPPLLRGRHACPQPVQAAEALLLTEEGPGWAVASSVERDGGWEVVLERDSERVAVHVVRQTEPELILTSCADAEPTPVQPLVVTRSR